jgi:transposase
MKKFKAYSQEQLPIFPLDISDLISEGHLVRVISQFVGGLSLDLLSKPFEKEGQPPYHPRMMMKVLLYAYSTKLFSTRKIEKALQQDITYMWISGMQKPDHNTINRFRGIYFKSVIEDVFTELLDFLQANGYIKFETYFVDGTKIEANANKYSYVWKKNVERNKEKLKHKVKLLLEEIDTLNATEDKIYGEESLAELGKNNQIDSKKIKEVADELNNKLKDKEKNKTQRTIKSRINKLTKASEKLDKYEESEKILGKRNSYSKTDTDAVFMRMKDDTLKPAYNIQNSSENLFIVNVSVSQNPADNDPFVEHLETIKGRGEKYIPDNYVGDAAYGSEENYDALESSKINSYLKYNSFDRDVTGKDTNPFSKNNMPYDEQKDCFICPMGKEIIFVEDDITVTARGYKSKSKVYKCENCTGCSFQEVCVKGKGNRIIRVRPQLEKLKQKAKENLLSQIGVEFRKRRGYEIETFFGDLKMNQGFRRFLLRGLEKIKIEANLLSIAYNLRKMNAIMNNKQIICG